jgi:hypothetical protein
MQTEASDKRGSDRRGEDRRKAQINPLPFPDRRKANRRSGTERRAAQD